MNNYKFNISKLDRLNKKLRQKPYIQGNDAKKII